MGTDPTAIKEGTLRMFQSTVFNTYPSRYFVVTPGRITWFYSIDEARKQKPEGFMELDATTKIYGGEQIFIFIQRKKTQIKLKAETLGSREAWLKALLQAVEDATAPAPNPPASGIPVVPMPYPAPEGCPPYIMQPIDPLYPNMFVPMMYPSPNGSAVAGAQPVMVVPIAGAPPGYYPIHVATPGGPAQQQQPPVHPQPMSFTSVVDDALYNGGRNATEKNIRGMINHEINKVFGAKGTVKG